MSKEIAIYLRERENDAKLEADRKAKEYLVSSMQKYATDVANEQTVSTVTLPNDEMKGRIIGREGRNIRTIESVTGVDLIIDDTPEAISLSSFDPLRREIARITIETLIKAGLVNKTYDGVKVLGNGTLEKKLTVKASKFSASAEAAIKNAGGTVEVI